MGQARASAQAPLLESVELTPRGRRRHKLQRTSPGGTRRTAHYTSPSKAEVAPFAADSDDENVQDELEMESWRRRGVAVEEVACQQSDAQRSAEVRAKRKAGKLPTPLVKRLCEYAGDMAGDRDVHGMVASALYG